MDLDWFTSGASGTIDNIRNHLKSMAFGICTGAVLNVILLVIYYIPHFSSYGTIPAQGFIGLISIFAIVIPILFSIEDKLGEINEFSEFIGRLENIDILYDVYSAFSYAFGYYAVLVSIPFIFGSNFAKAIHTTIYDTALFVIVTIISIVIVRWIADRF